MPSNPANRTLRFPPGDFSNFAIPRTRQPERNWFRIHRSVHKPDHFSINSAHRYSHPDSLFPLLYVAVDPATCLFERFGDTAYDGDKTIPQSLWNAQSVSMIWIPELHVCDLTNAKTLSALMVDLGALMHTDISAPQAWSLAIQQHPAAFQGIKYKSRFNAKSCLALFKRDRAETRVSGHVTEELSNDDSAVDWLDKHKFTLF